MAATLTLALRNLKVNVINALWKQVRLMVALDLGGTRLEAEVLCLL